ncbi:MAG: hypothetical protein IPG71_01540 [bacterium]|nr:hypothetical protein [bacterium]
MRFAALLFAVVLVVTAAFAVVPTTMSYQAVFTDTEGNVMPDGVYTIGFHIFPSAAGGPPVWSEWQDVTVSNGVFEVILGALFPLDPSDFLDPEGDGQWISISYEDTWMHPRQFISSVPYAFISCWADSARSSANVGSLSEQELIDNVNQVDNHETRIDALEAAEFGMFSQNANGGIVGTTPVAFPSFTFDVGGPASIIFFAQVINDGMDHSAWKALLQLQDVDNGSIVSGNGV